MLLAGMLTAALTMTVYGDENIFLKGSQVNGLDVGEMTVEQAAAYITNYYATEYALTIHEKGGQTETIAGSEIGFTATLPEGSLDQALQQENAAGGQVGPGLGSRSQIQMAVNYNVDALNAKIEALNCVSGEGVIPTTDACVSGYQEGQAFTIIPEKQGNDLDLDITKQVIQNAVFAGAREVDLEASGCYRTPKIRKDSPELLNLLETMKLCQNMTITYVIGENQEVLDPGTICSWLTGTQDGEIQVNRDLVTQYIQALAGKYNTAGTERTFHTATGRDVAVAGPYGWAINQAAEVEALIGMIRTGQSQSREPEYSSQAVDHSAAEWGMTYAEVDLTGQHVYMTVNGAVVWDAPCVTGNTSKGNGTPAGIYSIAYKERDRVLRGERRADGSYEYESPVSYWMPFNGGIGFHDANWRGSFGGTIYQTNGSHGCVNLPPSAVPALYDLVYKGMPVICYN